MTKTTKTTKALLVALPAAALVLGGVGIAAAIDGPPAAPVTEQEQVQQDLPCDPVRDRDRLQERIQQQDLPCDQDRVQDRDQDRIHDPVQRHDRVHDWLADR